MAGQAREPLKRAVVAWQAQDAADQAKEPRGDFQPVGDGPLAVAADDAAAVGGEVNRRGSRISHRQAALDAGVKLGQITRLAQQVQLEREERFLYAWRPK